MNIPLRLENLEEFMTAMRSVDQVALRRNGIAPINPGLESNLFCPRCQQRRRMAFNRWFWNEPSEEVQRPRQYLPITEPQQNEAFIALLTPSAYSLKCVQCDAQTLAVIYEGPNGRELALLRNVPGHFAVAKAPPGVEYYLDQAFRAQAVGANSAALAMYRAALEFLLFDQGFKTGMCGQKIGELEAAIQQHRAPAWAEALDTDDLKILKCLGDGAVHPNGGDISKQQTVTADLVAAVMIEFEKLLEEVYERPARDQARRDKLKAAATHLKQ